MNTHEALRLRRTVHRYVPGPLAPGVLERALEAAHMAPCHKLTWPWRWIITGAETRQRLADIAVAVKEAKRGSALSPNLERVTRAKIVDASELIVASQILADDDFRRREDYAAVSCAIQNMMLSAAADGYGSKWSTSSTTTDPATYETLGIDPAVEEIVGFVFLGEAALVPEISRPSFDSLVRRLP